jgi:hypothetical protein
VAHIVIGVVSTETEICFLEKAIVQNHRIKEEAKGLHEVTMWVKISEYPYKLHFRLDADEI